MTKRKVKVTITKNPDFKLLYADGVFGSLTPLEGFMIFYVDRHTPKMIEGPPEGRMETDLVERELQVEIHMSPQEFVSMSNWMRSHIEKMKKQGVIVVEDEKVKKTK